LPRIPRRQDGIYHPCTLLFCSAAMAIHSTYLGSMQLSGEDAKSFSQKVTHSRGTKAASQSAASGKKMVASFVKDGVVTLKLGKPKGTVRVGVKKVAK
jgi:hypothetical protein